MKKMQKSLTKFSVIKYNKIHYSSFYKHFFVEQNNSLIMNQGINIKKKTINNDFIKTRPAIIIGSTIYSYVIVPLTTKVSKNKIILKEYRTEIELNKKTSYICWDEVNYINKHQITGYWINEDGKPITLTTSLKRKIKAECTQKYLKKIMENK